MDDSLRHSTEFVIMQFVSPHLNIKELSLPWLIRLCTKTENTGEFVSSCSISIVSPLVGGFVSKNGSSNEECKRSCARPACASLCKATCGNSLQRNMQNRARCAATSLSRNSLLTKQLREA